MNEINQKNSKKAYITTGQLFTLLFVSKISLTILYSTAVSGIGSLWDMLMPLLLSMPVMLIFILPSVILFKRNRNDSITTLSTKLFGKFGKIIPLLYAAYFSLSFFYLDYVLKQFLDSVLNDEIQSVLIVSAFVIAAIYAAVKGIEALSRLSAIVFMLLMLCGTLVFVFLLPNYSSENLVPAKLISYSTTLDGLIFILSRMNAAAAVNVFAPQTKGRLLRSSYLWIIYLFLFIILMLVISVGAVGDYLNTRTFQSYRMIDGSGALQRLNPLFLLVSACCVFCNMSLLLLSFAQCTESVFTRYSHKTVTVVGGILRLGALLIAFSLDSQGTIIFNKYIWLVLAVVFILFIPLVMLIADWLRSSHKARYAARRAAGVVSIVLAVIIAVPTLTGCTGTQLNQRLIVQGAGIDKLSDGCRLTLIVLDTDDQEHDNSSRIICAEGKDTTEAFTKLENERGRRILLSQCLFIMMDQNAVNACDDTLSYFAEKDDLQKTTGLTVSEKSAQETLLSAVERFHYNAESINVLSDSKEISQPTVHCSFMDYMSSLKNTGTAMLFPYITVDEETASLQTNGSYLVDRTGEHYYMNADETAGTLIINRKALNFTDAVTDSDTVINYSIKNISTSITPRIINNQLNIDFTIHVFLDSPYDQEESQKITDDIFRKVQSSVDKTVSGSGSDIFSVSRYIRSAYPDFYKGVDDWKALFRQSETTVRLSCADKG